MSLPLLPSEIKRYLLFYELEPREAAALCSTSKSFSLFCRDRELRLKTLINYYLSLSLEQYLEAFGVLLIKVPFDLLNQANASLRYRDSDRLEACVRAHPELLNSKLLPIGYPNIRMPPLAIAAGNQATLLLLALGASPKALGDFGPRALDIPVIEYTGLSPVKLPLLFSFWSEPRDLNKLRYLLGIKDARTFYFVSQVSVGNSPGGSVAASRLDPLQALDEVSAELDEYALMLELLHHGLDLTQAPIAQKYKGLTLNESHPIMIILGLCYGLNIDLPITGGPSYLEELLEGYPTEELSDLTSILLILSEDRIQPEQDVLLSLSYPSLAYLQQHGLNGYWDSQPFWLEKLKRDYHMLPLTTGNLRLEYLSLYERVIIIDATNKSYPIPNASYGQGFLYALHILRGERMVQGVQMLGFKLDLKPNKALKLLDQMYLTSNLYDPLIFLTSGIVLEEVQSLKYSVYLTPTYRLQYDSKDFLLGMIVACQSLNIDPFQVLSTPEES